MLNHFLNKQRSRTQSLTLGKPRKQNVLYDIYDARNSPIGSLDWLLFSENYDTYFSDELLKKINSFKDSKFDILRNKIRSEIYSCPELINESLKKIPRIIKEDDDNEDIEKIVEIQISPFGFAIEKKKFYSEPVGLRF